MNANPSTVAMTEKDARDLVALALAACPTAASFLDAPSVQAMRRVWFKLLADLPLPAVEAALMRYLAIPENAGKLPSPGHLRGIAAESVNGRRRAGGDAFGDVEKNAHLPPSMRVWPDARARWAFERLGGWLAWAELTVGAATAAFRARFIELYDSAAKHDAEDAAVGLLPGAARPALAGSSSNAALPSGDRDDSAPARVGDVLRLVPGGRP